MRWRGNLTKLRWSMTRDWLKDEKQLGFINYERSRTKENGYDDSNASRITSWVKKKCLHIFFVFYFFIENLI